MSRGHQHIWETIITFRGPLVHVGGCGHTWQHFAHSGGCFHFQGVFSSPGDIDISPEHPKGHVTLQPPYKVLLCHACYGH